MSPPFARPAPFARRTSARDEATTLRRRLLALRVVSLAPLVVGLAAWWLVPAFRAAFAEAFAALRAGDIEGLRSVGAELGGWAALMTIVLMIVQALAAPLPAVVVTVANSLLFGPFLGGCLSIASATLAAVLCFALARAWGEPLVARLVPRAKLARANAFLERHGALAVLGARLIPFVPFDPISYVAGLTRMRWWTFVWATLVGQIPAGMAYSYLAQELDRPLHVGIAASATFVGLCLLAWLVVLAFSKRDKAA